NGYTGQTAYFSNITYEWPYMLLYPKISDFGYNSIYNIYNNYKMQIGVLMLEIGANVAMQYGTGSSNAYFYDVPKAFVAMGYNPAKLMNLSTLMNYDQNSVWNSIYYGMPVLVNADDGNNSYTWIMDNYAASSDYYTFPSVPPYSPIFTLFFHCNLGCGGSDDGWYLDMFNVNSNYNYKYNAQIIPNISN
ncbi:MAG: C10 family peptidase, partial [Treponema sp.]|nr:C10 family peptidase [Treponema sp.]